MSEWIAMLVACVAGLSVAVALARRAAVSGEGGPGLERLLAAVRRASDDFLWQENRQILIVVAVVSAALIAPSLLDAPRRAPAHLGWSALALGVGAFATVIVAWTSRKVTERGVLGALSVLRATPGPLPAPAFKSAAASALIVDATSLIATVAVFAGHFLFLRWGVADPPSSLPFEASRILPTMALGAVCAAAVYQVGGSSFHTATGVTASTLLARAEHRHSDEDQNPVLVAELVGDSVGDSVGRCTDAFATLTFANTALVTVCSAIAAGNTANMPAALAISALPLLIRAGGLFACAICAGNLRLDAEMAPPTAFAAATASCCLMTITALSGAAYWLIGEPHFSTLLAAGALGVLAPVLSSLALVWLNRRAAFPDSPDPGDLPRPETSVPRALGLGLQQTWPPLAIVGGCVGAAWMLGANLPVRFGGGLALAVSVSALLGTAAVSITQDLLPTISQSVRRVTTLRRGGFESSAREQAQELDRLSESVGNLGRTQLILGAGATALLAAITLPITTGDWQHFESASDPAHPVVLLGGLLGAGSLSFFVGSALRTSTRTANLLGRELHQDFDAEIERVVPAPARAPTYAPSVRLASEGAKAAILPLSLLAVGVPLAVGMGLALAYGGDDSPVATQGLMSYAIIATLTGCFAALAAQGALAALEALPTTTGSSSPTAGQFLRRSIGPAALLALKATVVASIAATSFLSMRHL